MEIFDVMTGNRDRKVWAIADGGDLTINDQNTPPLVEVKTNIPGPLPGGKFPFLGGDEGIGKMKIAEGMQVNLFASEEQFPELIKPVQMAVDTDGRLWAATWPTYPHWNPKEPMRDKIVILPDDDGDGKADRLIVFADGLNSVTGFEFWGGGVLVAAAPEILFLKDTDGDDKADVKIRMLQGISAGIDYHAPHGQCTGDRPRRRTVLLARRVPRRQQRDPDQDVSLHRLRRVPLRPANCSKPSFTSRSVPNPHRRRVRLNEATSSPATAREAAATTLTSATGSDRPRRGIRRGCGRCWRDRDPLQ